MRFSNLRLNLESGRTETSAEVCLLKLLVFFFFFWLYPYTQVPCLCREVVGILTLHSHYLMIYVVYTAVVIIQSPLLLSIF